MDKTHVWPFAAGSTRLTAQLMDNVARTWFYAWDEAIEEGRALFCIVTGDLITYD